MDIIIVLGAVVAIELAGVGLALIVAEIGRVGKL